MVQTDGIMTLCWRNKPATIGNDRIRILRRTAPRSRAYVRVGSATAVVALALAGCGAANPGQVSPSSAPFPTAVPTTPGLSPALGEADAAFASDLYAQVARSAGNIVLSPSSIATVLQMALLGARGATADQLRAALHLGGANDEQLVSAAAATRRALAGLTSQRSAGELLTSDRLWLDNTFAVDQAFAAGLEAGWMTPVTRLAFRTDPNGARDTINAAVAHETDDEITGLLAPGAIGSTTRFVLTDAVYLKADWMTPFDRRDTRPGPFTPPGSGLEQVPVMHETVAAAYLDGPGYQALRIPYVGGRLAMTILLPTQNLAPLEQHLGADGLSSLLTRLHDAEVAVALPTFQVSGSTELTGPLEQIGVTDAFSPSADFSGIDAPANGLSLSGVVHRAVVHVDEAGTEAAAATAAVGGDSAIVAPPIPQAYFTVDRPFLFVITDQTTGLPLFLGRVDDPGLAT